MTKKRSYETCDLMHGNICVSKPCICKGMSMAKKRKENKIGKAFADGYKAQYGPKKRKPGGGRKSGEPTKVIRVPASKVEDIKKLIGKS